MPNLTPGQTIAHGMTVLGHDRSPQRTRITTVLSDVPMPLHPDYLGVLCGAGFGTFDVLVDYFTDDTITASVVVIND